jgi:hypothetical protein
MGDSSSDRGPHLALDTQTDQQCVVKQLSVRRAYSGPVPEVGGELERTEHFLNGEMIRVGDEIYKLELAYP